MTHHAEWLAQAERDLEVADKLISDGYNEWAAYAAQQAAEKAAKAVRIALGTEVEQIKLHKLAPLLGQLPALAPDPQLGRAGELDVHNEQARYPGLRGSTVAAPFRTYTSAQASDLVTIARSVVAYAKGLVPDIEKFWATR